MANTVDVEVILHESSVISKKSIIGYVQKYLENIIVRPNSIINFGKHENTVFHKDVKSIMVGDVSNYNKSFVDFSSTNVNWFVYRLDGDGPLTQNEEDEDEGEITFSTLLTLPSVSLFNLWENLYYDNNIKQNLLKYAQTIMEFSDKGVDTNIISCNKVVLLYGPPGTGKTSLCKALAQKLTIRMGQRFSSGILIEINSHSLFSKWFSESGKLVNKMFTKIHEHVENRETLVCILIDEIESLAHARSLCVSGTEPSDSIRVVNALLTQIDRIKRHPNVLVFTTSNMTECIDLAFVDRADIKQYLGVPSVQAIYKVYHSCINELIKAQIIQDQILEPIEHIVGDSEKIINLETQQLLNLCHKSVGLSGRSLRKIPFLAHALFLKGSLINLREFLDAMEKAVAKELLEMKNFGVDVKSTTK